MLYTYFPFITSDILYWHKESISAAGQSVSMHGVKITWKNHSEVEGYACFTNSHVVLCFYFTPALLFVVRSNILDRSIIE